MQNMLQNRTQGLKPHIIFLTRSVSFPNGMAATQRVKLLARCLVESGMDVSILCTQVSERSPLIENKESKGTYQGIHFEYTTGSTIRSKSFILRRLVELRGILVTILRLIEIKGQKQVCCIYYYGNVFRNSLVQWLFFTITRLLNLPFVVDVCERPWTMEEKGLFWNKSMSPVWGCQGAVVISDFLRVWAEQEKNRVNHALAILQLPILVDVNEQVVVPYISGDPNVLFACSPVYDQTVQFLLDAIRIVWRKYPKCKLIITGCLPEDPASKAITRHVQNYQIESSIELVGFLSRKALLKRYAEASALLIPLFDDTRSKARFPTKLGEYLASGRPIVTNSVGEAARFFAEGKNAYMCEPGDATIYAQKIIEVLEDQDKANRIGMAGRKLAVKNFHYSLQSERFAGFVESLCY